MQRQAERFGTEVLIDYVTEIDVTGPPFTVKTASGSEFQDRVHHRGHRRLPAAHGRAE